MKGECTFLMYVLNLHYQENHCYPRPMVAKKNLCDTVTALSIVRMGVSDHPLSVHVSNQSK